MTKKKEKVENEKRPTEKLKKRGKNKISKKK